MIDLQPQLLAQWRQLYGQEDVTLAPGAGGLIVVAGAVGLRIDRQEVQASGGFFTSRDRVFWLPVQNLAGAAPAEGDRITQASGAAWSVLEAGLVVRETSYRCVSRRLRGGAPAVVPPPPGGDEPTGYSAQNRDLVTFAAGQPLAVHSSGTGVLLAEAMDNQKNAVGLAKAPAAPGFSAQVLTEGVVQLSDWSAVTGTVALAPRAVYYLDTAPGRLTNVAPSVPGQIVQAVGRAVSPQALDIEIEEPILL